MLDVFGERNIRVEQAIQYLQKSNESDPKSGQTLYLLEDVMPVQELCGQI